MHIAPWTYSKHAPGAVCIQIVLLEYIWLIIFFSPGLYKSRPKSLKALTVKEELHPWPKFACFVLYFKIINTLKNNICILRLSKELNNGIEILVG